MTTVSLDPVAVPEAPAAPQEGAEDSAARAESLQRRLAASLVQLRSAAATPAGVERRIAVLGGAMIAGGAVLVLLGWYGAANTSRLYLQIPYLISGGLLGIAIAVAGGCTYLASWLTRLVHEERERSDEAVAVARDAAASLARIEALLAAGAGAGAGSGGSATALAGAAFVATPSGRLAHRPTCPSVAGRSDLRAVDPTSDGLAPCRMCDNGGA